MTTLRDIVRSRIVQIFAFVLLLSLFCFPTEVNAQERVTGLGYVDTKIFQRDTTIYYPSVTVTDSQNNVYITGEMNEDYAGDFENGVVDLDWNAGVSNYEGSLYLAKYSSQKQFLWGISLGDINGNVSARGMVVDSNNNLYISGTYTGTVDFDYSPGTDSRVSNSADAFIMKINADGSYGWVRTWGGASYDYAYNVAVDSVRNSLYVIGHLYSTNLDLDPGAGTDIEAKSGLMIAKYDLSGNYLWGNAYGNLGGTSNRFIQVKESTGDVYFGSRMWAQTIDFDPGAGTYNITGTSTSSYISRLTSDNTHLGTTLLTGMSLQNFKFDSVENMFLIGTFSGTIDFDPSTGTNNMTSAGGNDVFLSKWNASTNPFVDGNAYAWSRRFGGTGTDNVFALNTDSYDNVYIGGIFRNLNVDFDFSAGTDIHSIETGHVWSFMTLVKNNGDYLKTYSWGSRETGVSGYVDLMSISIDSQNRVYAYGSYYEDVDFDPSVANLYNLRGYSSVNYGANYDLYVSIFYPYISIEENDPVGVFGITGETYSSDSSLSSLTTSQGAVVPAFSPSNLSYTKSVDSSVGGMSLTASTTSSAARLAINGYGIQSGTESALKALKNGETNLQAIVWSEDQSSTSTYTVTAIKPFPQGTNYTYTSAKQIGDIGSSIATGQGRTFIDQSGNFYIAGSFNSGPVDFGVASVGDDMTQGSYLLKLDQNQNVQWVRRWVNDFNNGIPYMYIADVEFDSAGALYVVGGYLGPIDLDPTEGVDSRVSGGTLDAYMIKLNADGSVGFIHTWGSDSVDSSEGIAIDSNDNIYVGGQFYATADFDPTASTNTIQNPSARIHGYVSKFATNGNYIWTKVYETTAGSSDFTSVSVSHIDVDSQGNIYSIGDMDGYAIDFDPSAGTDLRDAEVDGGTFLTKLNADGTYAWTKVSIGEDYISVENGGDMVIDSLDRIYITGNYSADSYYKAYLNPDSPTTEYPSINETDDIFVQKYNPDGSVVWVKTFGSASYDYPNALAINSDNNLFIAGWYDKPMDFDPDLGDDTLTPLYAGVGAGSGYISQINNEDIYVRTYSFHSDDWAEITAVNFTPNGNMYATGIMYGTTDTDPGESTDSKNMIGTIDTFISNFTSGEVLSNNANLASLVPSRGSLVPSFSASTTSYSMEIDNSVMEFSFTPTAQDSTILGIDINGIAVNSGETSSPISLSLGSNIFSITVTAADNTTRTYVVDVEVVEPIVLSSNTNLSSLSVSVGNIYPQFSPSTHSYSVDVPTTTGSIFVTPVPEDSNITHLQVNGESVTVGQASQHIPLYAGQNSITILVTAEDGVTVGTYTVYVNRDDSVYTPGIKVEWAQKAFGGNTVITPIDVCYDSAGSIYTIGRFQGSNVNLGYPNATALYSVASGDDDDFLIKYDQDGAFQWARVLSGVYSTTPSGYDNFDESINTCVTDRENNVYIGGYFSGTVDLDLTGGTDVKTASGIGDGFLTKYDSSGNYENSFLIVSTDVNRPEQVRTAIFSNNHLYLAGSMYAGDTDIDGTDGVDLQQTLGHGDTYISKYTLTGEYVGGTTIVGINYDEDPVSIAADPQENLYVAGYWHGPSIDFDSSASGTDIKNATSSREIYLTKFDSELSYQWTRTVYGSGVEELTGINLDVLGNIYMAGNAAQSSVLNIEGSTPFTPVNSDGFIIKYLPNGSVDYAKFLEAPGLHWEKITDIQLYNNKFYLIGYFYAPIDLDFGEGTKILDPINSYYTTFVGIYDQDLNYLNATVLTPSFGGKTAVSGDYLAFWGTSFNQIDNASMTYMPYPLSTNYSATHAWLGKYKEVPIYSIRNTTNELDFKDSLFNQAVTKYSFLAEDTPNVKVIKQPENGLDNIREVSSDKLFDSTGTFLFSGDDDYIEQELPFSFPFYDSEYSSLLIGTNGMVCFDLSVECDWYIDDDYTSSIFGPYIMPLGLDSVTNDAEGDGVFVNSNANSYTIIWKGYEYGSVDKTIQFALTLYPSGEFEFTYGPQSQDFSYNDIYIGVGAGDGVKYTEASNAFQYNYNYSQSLKWLPAEPPMLLAEMNVNMNANRDWSNVNGTASRTLGKSLTRNLHSAPGVTSSSMYVPYAEGTQFSRIILCPGVSALDDIKLDCLNGQAVRIGKSGVSGVEYLGQQYVKLTGYGSVGAMIAKSNSLTVTASNTRFIKGGSTSITVSVKDMNGNIDTTFTGTLRITTNIPGLPSQYTFTSGESGVHTFSNIVIAQAGTYSFSARDILDSQVLGASSSIIVTNPLVPPTDPGDDPQNPPTVPGDEPEIPPTTDPGTEGEPEVPPTEEPNVEDPNDVGEDSDEGDSDWLDISLPVVVTESFNRASRIVRGSIERLSSATVESPATVTLTVGSFSAVLVSTIFNAISAGRNTSVSTLQLMSSLFAFGKLKKKTQNYGLVYDSVTKEPIGRAVVRVMDADRKLVTTAVSDIQGIFDISLPDGVYQFNVDANGYSFPTNIIQTSEDEPYKNIYRGGLIQHSSSQAINISIPVDISERKLVQESATSIKNILKRTWDILLVILFLIGFATTIATLFNSPVPLSWIIFSVYVLFLISFVISQILGRKKFGYIKNSDGQLVTDLEIGLIEQEFDTLYAKRVTDSEGKYRFIVPGGKYKLVLLDSRFEFVGLTKDIFEVKDGSVLIIKNDLIVKNSTLVTPEVE